MTSPTSAKVQTIDAYLARLPHHQRLTLEKLRGAIKAALPEAEEGINYGMPSFRIGGKVICGFAAASRHCAFYPWSARTVATLADDLRAYETSKGTIRFRVERPLPNALVRKVIKTRLAEIAEPAVEVAQRPSKPRTPAATAGRPSESRAPVGAPERPARRSSTAKPRTPSATAERPPHRKSTSKRPRPPVVEEPVRPKRPRNHGRGRRDPDLDLDR